MIPDPYAAAVCAKLITIEPDFSPKITELPQPWQTIAGALQACPKSGELRATAFMAALARMDPSEAETIRAAVWAADPMAPLPVSRVYRTRWTAGELLTTDFPEPRWAVPGLIPEGLTILAGRPKIGKSWLSLQIAVAVGTGGMVFDHPVEPGRVLFLALEDSDRRLKSRLVKQQAPGSADVIFHTAWRAFSDGGLADLENAARDEKITLVIVDTFSRAVGRVDQLDPAEMTLHIGSLQRIAQANQISILLIDHHRKGGGFEADPIADILGATAKAAAADGALGLYRQNSKREYSLKITGRDVEESELALVWDGLTCSWQSLGAADDVRENTLKADILQAMREIIEDGELATTRRIADRTGKDAGNISRGLADLMATGKVRRIEQRGRERPYEPLS